MTAAIVFPSKAEMLKTHSYRSLGDKNGDRLQPLLRKDATSTLLHHPALMALL